MKVRVKIFLFFMKWWKASYFGIISGKTKDKCAVSFLTKVELTDSTAVHTSSLV